MLEEFKKFAVRGNVVDMAVGIIIGAAFGKIVDSLVKDLIMPPIGLLLGKVDFANLFLVIKEGASAGPYVSLEAAQKAGAVTVNYGVFINTAISFVRKRAIRSDRVVFVEHADLARTIESRQTAEESTDERIANLYTAIFKLDPLEKAVITLFLEDFTYEQMAEITGITANNVGVMLHRARKKLSSLMEAPK